jgi:hypothetical protein
MEAKQSLKQELVESRLDAPCNRHDKKIVSWGNIIVFEFPNLLGDNPAVSGGAPLTIGWNHDSVNVVTIEYYEFMRLKRPRRRRKDMILSSAQRDTVSYCLLCSSVHSPYYFSI